SRGRIVGPRRAGLCRRDATLAARRAADHVGTRARPHPGEAHRRLGRRAPHEIGRGAVGGRRRRPYRGEWRHCEQDRHLPVGDRGAPPRREGHGRGAVLDRRHAYAGRQPHRDRTARAGRTLRSGRPPHGRRGRRRLEPGVRRHAGGAHRCARDGAWRHRASRRRAHARGVRRGGYSGCMSGWRQFATFCIGGTLGFVVDAGVLQILVVGFGWDRYRARILSFLAAATATWIFNRSYTFRGPRRHSLAGEWARYIVAMSGGFVCNFLAYSALVYFLDLQRQWLVLAV